MAGAGATLPKHTLEGLLMWVQREHKALKDLLDLMPPEMPEYDILHGRLEKLEAKLVQIRGQLAAQ